MALATLMVGGLAATAGAQVYPPTAGVVTTGVSAGGTTVNCAGSNLLVGSTYTCTVQSDPVVVASGTVGASGSFSQTAEVPCSIGNGQHTITATGTGADGKALSSSTSFNLSGCVISTGALAFTGSNDSLPIAGGAVALVLAGIVLLVVGLRRRNTHSLQV